MNDTPLLKKDIIWNIVGTCTYLFCQWLMTIIVVRIGDFEMAGEFSLAISVTNIFYIIALYGVRTFQISDYESKYKHGVYILTRILMCVIAMLMCIFFCIKNIYTINQQIIIILYMLFKIMEALIDVYQGIQQKMWRLDIVGKSFIIRGVLTLLAFTIAVYYTNALFFAILNMILVSVGVLVFYDIKICKKLTFISFTVYPKEIFGLLRECTVPCLIYICITSCTSIPRYFLEQILGSEILGIYSSIATPTIIIQVLLTLIFNPLLPLFAQYYFANQFVELKRLVLKCFTLIFLIAIGAIGGGIVFGEVGIRILFGNEVVKYNYLLLPIVICTILTAIIWLLVGILISIREFKWLVIGSAMGLISSIVGSPLLIGYYGMNGANIVFILAALVTIFIIIGPIINLLKIDDKKIDESGF